MHLPGAVALALFGFVLTGAESSTEVTGQATGCTLLLLVLGLCLVTCAMLPVLATALVLSPGCPSVCSIYL